MTRPYFEMTPALDTEISRLLPPGLAGVVRNRWARTANQAGASGYANPVKADKEAWRALESVRRVNLPDGLDLAASAETVETRAETAAAKFRQKEMLGIGWQAMMQAAENEGIRPREVFEPQLRTIARAYAEGSDALMTEGIDGIVGRLKDKNWWTRQFYKFIYRAFEAVMRECGMVHRRAGLYVSDETFHRFEQRKAKAVEFFGQMEAICEETGEAFSLSELWAKSLANPAIRRMELMTRMRGFDEIGRVHGHFGCMVTLTCPSRFHNRLAADGRDNPKFDGSTPRDGADYLQKVWTQIRAKLDRVGIRVYGFRVAEPHHDGTPHWHLLLFMEQQHQDQFRRIFAKYGCRADREELGLRYFESDKERTAAAKERQAAILRDSGKKISLEKIKATMKTAHEFWARFDFKSWKSSKASARVDFKDIDPEKGTAAAYLAKYISKNIDGMKSDGEGMGEDEEAAPGTPASETAKRVGAWAAQWGIRQFQQIGGVPVTLYRELRRVHVDADDSLLYRAVHAADEGDWGKFVALLGGEDFAFVKRADLPLMLYKEETEERNKYGEAKPAILRGVVELETGEYLISRDKEWQLRQRDGGTAAAWTCVNNSTNSEFDLKTMINHVNKRKESIHFSKECELIRLKKQWGALRRDLSYDDEFGLVRFAKKRELQLLEQAMNQCRADAAISPEQSRALIAEARQAANVQAAKSQQQHALRQYFADLDQLGQLMQPSLNREPQRTLADAIPPRRPRFATMNRPIHTQQSVLHQLRQIMSDAREISG
nr:MAG TPA: Replication associated protein [Caudoviricetes sp.]